MCIIFNAWPFLLQSTFPSSLNHITSVNSLYGPTLILDPLTLPLLLTLSETVLRKTFLVHPCILYFTSPICKTSPFPSKLIQFSHSRFSYISLPWISVMLSIWGKLDIVCSLEYMVADPPWKFVTICPFWLKMSKHIFSWKSIP